MVLGPGGTIVWANQAFAQLVGREPDALVGSNGLDLVHPDELHRAADGILYAAQFPGRTSVAPYRLRHADGAWVDIELKSGMIDHPDGDHLALVVRDGTPRQTIARALRSVASGAPFEQTALLTCEAVLQRWPNTGAAVTYGSDGKQVVLGQDLPEPLLAHARGGHPGLPNPWDLCPEPETVVVIEASDLPEPLRRAAVDAGFGACAISRVADPGGAPCCLVVWFDHEVIARLEFRHASDELLELLALALEHRHHLWQLRHLARHDALTGVLNRVGFFEQFESDLVASRAEGSMAMALLYLDLDDLKVVNDRAGHRSGDELLAHVARQLRATCRDAVVARIGGDEFVVAAAVPASQAAEHGAAMADAVVVSLAEPAATGSGGPPVGASVGLAVDDGTGSASHLVERADAAMYRAKAAGKGRWST